MLYLAAVALVLFQTPDTPDAIAVRITTHIEALLAKEQPEMYARHLRSVEGLCQAEVIRLRFSTRNKEQQTKDDVTYLKGIEDGLNDDGDKPETYLRDGLRALTFARQSAVDDSLQYFNVGLPPHWDPAKQYPLVVGLHGAGPKIPIAYVYFDFLPHGINDKPPREVITIIPWGRGNRGWRDDGKSDLWEAVNEVKTFAKFDPDRWYITGHSMGGDGVWSIVNRTPDLWAAAGMQAGSTLSTPLELGLTPNCAYVPFYFWNGADDPLKEREPSCHAAYDLLEKLGDSDVKRVVSPGVGHSPRAEDGDAQMDWMLTHVRKRPSKFSFVLDTPRHRGVWGVTVPRAGRGFYALPEPRAGFTCEIKDGKVTITAENAKHLTVDLGPGGLQMAGNVELIVNGKSAYSGAVPSAPVSVDL